MILTSGSLALTNPFRFSSEYADDTIALVYYIYRHYGSLIGRWLSRDLIEEWDLFCNVYMMCANDCNNYFDKHGNAMSIIRAIPWKGIIRLIGKNFGDIESAVEKIADLYDDTRGEMLRRGLGKCLEGRTKGECDACCVVFSWAVWADRPKFVLMGTSVECSKCSDSRKISRLTNAKTTIDYIPIKIKGCQ